MKRWDDYTKEEQKEFEGRGWDEKRINLQADTEDERERRRRELFDNIYQSGLKFEDIEKSYAKHRGQILEIEETWY